MRYHFLPPLLVAEVQRLERERAQQQEALNKQTEDIDSLRDEVATLRRSSSGSPRLSATDTAEADTAAADLG